VARQRADSSLLGIMCSQVACSPHVPLILIRGCAAMASMTHRTGQQDALPLHELKKASSPGLRYENEVNSCEDQYIICIECNAMVGTWWMKQAARRLGPPSRSACRAKMVASASDTSTSPCRHSSKKFGKFQQISTPQRWWPAPPTPAHPPAVVHSRSISKTGMLCW